MYELKSIAILPFARTLGGFYFIVGLIFGVVAAIGAILHGHFLRALLALIFIGPIYGLVAFVLFTIGAWIYNHVAEQIGGIEFELVQH